MMYDDDQNYAINADGNVLISASAGSGKTAVLTERYLRLIKEGVNAANILVLTFSDKAAVEMKERIEAKLTAYAAVCEPKKARKLANDFVSANISTIHSFLHKIITKYFYELNIDPYFSIISGGDAEALKERAFGETVKYYNAKNDPMYDRLVYCLSGSRSDGGLFDAVEEYRELSTVMTEKGYDFDKSIGRCTDYIMANMRERTEKYSDIARTVAAECRFGQPYSDVADEIADKLKALTRTKSDADFERCIAETEKSSARILSKEPFETTEKIRVLKKYFNEMLKELKAALEELPYLRECAEQDREMIDKFVETTAYYSQKYAALKASDNKLDYSDLEQYAMTLLEKTAALEELREQYTHILVDEYQDTNRIQEYILNKLAKGQFFAVGDVKQSIFNFRLADPSIFLERRKSYSEGNGACRDLNNNYRTSVRLTDFINRIFSVVMTENGGGINYKRDAALKSLTEYGAEEYLPYGLAFFEKIEEKPETNGLYSVKDDANRAGASAANAEGLYIASVIKKLMGVQIYDPKTGAYRDTRYGDIAVIVRSRVGNPAKILDVLKSAGVPVRADGFGDGDNNCAMLIELLKVIDNSRNDISLATVMLSFFGGFTDDDLKEIRLNGYEEKFFCGAVGKYIADFYISHVAFKEGGRADIESAPTNSNDSDTTFKEVGRTNTEAAPAALNYKAALAAKLKGFDEYVNALRKKAADGGIYSLLCGIVYESGFDAYAGDKAASLERFMDGFADADYSLSYYLYNLKDGAPEQPKTAPVGGDKVTMMTAHASKGLEFPIVFVADAAHMFNKEFERKPYVFDSLLGIGFFYRDTANMTQKNTLFRKAVILKKNKEQREEEMRLFYVALTRAKNHLFISGSGSKFKESEEECVYKTQKSFMDFVGMSAFFDKNVKESFVTDTAAAELFGGAEAAPSPDEYDAATAEYLNRSLEASHRAVSVSPVKESATAVSRGDKISFLKGEGLFDKGNAYHKVMQYADFGQREKNDVAELIKRLVKENILSEKEAALVDIDDIVKCLNGPLVDYARKNRYVKEKEFMLYVPAKDVYPDGGEEKILVQGIIDLLVFGEKNIIADYKTGALHKDLKEVYKKQLNIYKKAAESTGIKIDEICLYSFESGTTLTL
ncbi:MAG: UvrD-helicase domain-containing protein [Clostridiales bacterium]|jgi:ATP-dependent helicase/nuclease subunit A|nr:UvrD-helicase domain-containing protein [Clostridiales bacterium]